MSTTDLRYSCIRVIKFEIMLLKVLYTLLLPQYTPSLPIKIRVTFSNSDESHEYIPRSLLVLARVA